MANENEKFYTGNTVNLVSGGPRMQVMGTPLFDWNQDMYVCQWFAGKTCKQDVFHRENLELSAPEKTVKRKTKLVRKFRNY